MNDKEALSIVSRQSPCPHECVDTSIGNGCVWAKREDCGATIEQSRIPASRSASNKFDDAINHLSNRLSGTCEQDQKDTLDCAGRGCQTRQQQRNETMKLYQLPNGQWVDPAMICGVVTLRGGYSSDAKATLPPRVRVDMRNSGMHTINCGTDEGAEEMRDKIAEDINALIDKAREVVG